MSIKIAGITIGLDYEPFIIAEMSGNHGNNLERAIALVDIAAKANVHALKVQTASPDGLTLNIQTEDFQINDPESLWFGRNLYDLYKDSVMPWEWHEEIFNRCKHHGIVGFSSPFEINAVDFLEKLDVPCYKIASFELVDLPLIERVAKTGKPIIISTGMANIGEIQDAITVCKKAGNDQIILLKCTSSYPASPEDSNLRTIEHLRKTFNTEVGLSDHTMGIGSPCASVAFGATVIEKHFTFSRDEETVDSAFSLEPEELSALVIETKRAWQSLGQITYGKSGSEKNSAQFRRSIYVCKNIKKGDQLTTDNIKIIRPGYGLEPKNYDLLIGKKTNKDLKIGSRMLWEHIG